MSEEQALINELRDTIPASQDMAHTLQGDRQERAADTIERLIRERDEARAELKYQTDRAEFISQEGRELRQALEKERNEAEQRGYRKGLEDALVRCDMEIHNGPFPFDVAKQEAHQWTAKAIRADILALLEQTESGEKK